MGRLKRPAAIVALLLAYPFALEVAGVGAWTRERFGRPAAGALGMAPLALALLGALKLRILRATSGPLVAEPLDLAAVSWADRAGGEALEAAVVAAGFAPQGGRRIVMGTLGESWARGFVDAAGDRLAVVSQHRLPGPLGGVAIGLVTTYDGDRRLVTTARPVDGVSGWLAGRSQDVLDSRPGADLPALLAAHAADRAALAAHGWGPPLPLDLEGLVALEARQWERVRPLLRRRPVLLLLPHLLRPPRGGRWPGPLSA
ncbi:MAG: hypothetical protein KF878_03985 [Planctomycetes bacterium]|nr:hypothetical protein [Planctomycetota bacterium]